MRHAEVLADTSAFIAVEQNRSLRAALPDRLAVSCITIGELFAGLFTAPDLIEKDLRLRTLLLASRLAPLAVDPQVAQTWAELRSKLHDSKLELDSNDSWIAATAIAYELPLATQDNDFVDVPGLELIRL